MAAEEFVPKESLRLVEQWMSLAEESYAPAEGLDFVPDRYRILQWLSTAHVQRDDCRSALPFARRAQAVEDAVLPEFWRARSSALFPVAVLC